MTFADGRMSRSVADPEASEGGDGEVGAAAAERLGGRGGGVEEGTTRGACDPVPSEADEA